MQFTQHLGYRSVMRRRDRLFCQIDLYPLVGTVLLLLIIFMVGQPTPHHHSIFNYVDLPQSTKSTPMPGALKEDALRVFLTRDGSIYFGNSRTAPDDLSRSLREGLRNGAEKRVFLIVDTRARYADVEPVLDAVRLAGIARATFIVRSAPHLALRSAHAAP
jgi:biopolymer transport protein ExbD